MVSMRDLYRSLENYFFFDLFSGALSFETLSQKSLLDCARSTYLTLGKSTPVRLLVPLHPFQQLKAFGSRFSALSITRLANLLAYFHISAQATYPWWPLLLSAGKET